MQMLIRTVNSAVITVAAVFMVLAAYAMYQFLLLFDVVLFGFRDVWVRGWHYAGRRPGRVLNPVKFLRHYWYGLGKD